MIETPLPDTTVDGETGFNMDESDLRTRKSRNWNSKEL
jgi:hypothetical protein